MEKIAENYDFVIGNIAKNLTDFYDNEEYRLYDESFQKIKDNYTCPNLKAQTLILVDLVNIYIEFNKLYYMVCEEKRKYITMKENKEIPHMSEKQRMIAIMMASFNVVCKMYAQQGTYYSNKFYADMSQLSIESFNIVEQMVLRVFFENIRHFN